MFKSFFISFKIGFLLFSLLVHVLILEALRLEGNLPILQWFISITSFSLSSYKFFTQQKRGFALAILFHPLIGLFFLSNITDYVFLIFLFSGLLIIEGSLYLDLPWSLLSSFYPIFIQFIFLNIWFPSFHELQSLLFILSYITSLIVLCISAVLSVHFREALLLRNREVIQLKDTLLKLNRSNRDFQDSLFRIESESAEQERKRITRDVHDLVGYTMTNNIILMEMATDLMKTDPLEVSRLINIARNNAQDGLEEIRSILYKYRRENSKKSSGLQAVSNQIALFKSATEIQISFNMGNCPMSFGWDLDSIIYNMVQESMLNSYCHGQASEISVFLSLTQGNEINILIQDNGLGADNLKEGIGLRGMKERLEQYGGTLSYGNNNLGFQVIGEIPYLFSRSNKGMTGND